MCIALHEFFESCACTKRVNMKFFSVSESGVQPLQSSGGARLKIHVLHAAVNEGLIAVADQARGAAKQATVHRVAPDLFVTQKVSFQTF